MSKTHTKKYTLVFTLHALPRYFPALFTPAGCRTVVPRPAKWQPAASPRSRHFCTAPRPVSRSRSSIRAQATPMASQCEPWPRYSGVLFARRTSHTRRCLGCAARRTGSSLPALARMRARSLTFTTSERPSLLLELSRCAHHPSLALRGGQRLRRRHGKPLLRVSPT